MKKLFIVFAIVLTVVSCKMETQTAGNPVCLNFTKHLDQRVVVMSVEIVQDNINDDQAAATTGQERNILPN